MSRRNLSRGDECVTDPPEAMREDAPGDPRCVTPRTPRRWRDDKRAKGFSRGGPRKGVAYEVELVKAALRGRVPEEACYPLRAVAVRFLLHPRNLYFRLRRHRIPYLIGPSDRPPGRQVMIPLSSLPLLQGVIWRLPGSRP